MQWSSAATRRNGGAARRRDATAEQRDATAEQRDDATQRRSSGRGTEVQLNALFFIHSFFLKS